jgi:hypothetical protein
LTSLAPLDVPDDFPSPMKPFHPCAIAVSILSPLLSAAVQ